MILGEKNLDNFKQLFHSQDAINRLNKLQHIREAGVDPYPHTFAISHSIKELVEVYKERTKTTYNEALEKPARIKIAGRIILLRNMGKNSFAHIQNGGYKIQLLFNKAVTTVSNLDTGVITAHNFITKTLDLGDIIGLNGSLFKTNKGELTLFVKELTLLTKALLPLPDKHCGLVNQEIRYRKRWQDLVCNSAVVKTFEMRSKIIFEIRQHLTQKEAFLEVETPVIQNVYDGAEADPFITHMNAIHKNMYLRIALETSLKKLIAGGIPRVFEIGKVFRNESIDRTHNPEFTMLEAYATYMDYNDVMDLTERLIAHVSNALFNTTLIKSKDMEGKIHEIDLTPPWRRITMKDAILEFGKLDIDQLDMLQMRQLLKEKSNLAEEDIDKATHGKLIAYLFEEFAEKQLIQPHHVIDHPIETTPFCKPCRNKSSDDVLLVERFETFILGYEFCNAYSELNDPVLQYKLLERNSEVNIDFIEALAQGMPPTGGLGIGIDRLIMLFTAADSIRDVIFFPIMKPLS